MLVDFPCAYISYILLAQRIQDEPFSVFLAYFISDPFINVYRKPFSEQILRKSVERGGAACNKLSKTSYLIPAIVGVFSSRFNLAWCFLGKIGGPSVSDVNISIKSVDNLFPAKIQSVVQYGP